MSLARVTPETFRRSCAKFATGIAIATVCDSEGLPHGLTVNSFTSVSSVPPLVLICIDYSCTILPLFRNCSHYGINILQEEQQALSKRFAQKGLDRFDNIPWLPGQTGVPLLPHCLALMECAVRQTVEAGDHAVFIAAVVRASFEEGRPLLYFNSDYKSLR